MIDTEGKETFAFPPPSRPLSFLTPVRRLMLANIRDDLIFAALDTTYVLRFHQCILPTNSPRCRCGRGNRPQLSKEQEVVFQAPSVNLDSLKGVEFRFFGCS